MRKDDAFLGGMEETGLPVLHQPYRFRVDHLFDNNDWTNLAIHTFNACAVDNSGCTNEDA